MTDIEIGTDVVRKFYKYWSAYPGNSSTSFEQLLSALKARRPMGGTAFLDGLGLGVREADLSDSRIDRAMKNLAYSAGSGKLPAKNLDFWAYLSNESARIDFVDASLSVAGDTSSQLASDAFKVTENTFNEGYGILRDVSGKVVEGTKVGLESSISILKQAPWVIPAILIGGAFLYVFMKSGGVKGFKGK